LAGFIGHESQAVQGIRMIRLKFKDMLIERASPIQSTILAMFCCSRQDLGNVRHVLSSCYKTPC
jgi:hypothetical protein